MSNRICTLPMKCAVGEVIPNKNLNQFQRPSKGISPPVTAPWAQKIAYLVPQHIYPKSPQFTSAPAIKSVRLLPSTSSESIGRALNAVAAVAPPPYRNYFLAGAAAVAWMTKPHAPPLRFQSVAPFPLNEGSVIQPNGPTAHSHPDGTTWRKPELEGRPSDTRNAAPAVPGKAVHATAPTVEGFGTQPPLHARDLVLMHTEGSGSESKLPTIAVQDDGSFLSIHTVGESDFGNGVLKGKVEENGPIRITEMGLRPQGYDPEYLIEGVSGDTTAAYGSHLRSTGPQQEMTMVEQTLEQLGQSQPIHEVTVTLPFDQANSSSAAQLIQALHANAGENMTRGDAAYYLDNHPQVREAIANLPVSQSLRKFGLQLKDVHTAPDQDVVNLTFRP